MSSSSHSFSLQCRVSPRAPRSVRAFFLGRALRLLARSARMNSAARSRGSRGSFQRPSLWVTGVLASPTRLNAVELFSGGRCPSPSHQQRLRVLVALRLARGNSNGLGCILHFFSLQVSLNIFSYVYWPFTLPLLPTACSCSLICIFWTVCSQYLLLINRGFTL